MLDLFRRKQRGLKFILWIVIIGLGMGMLLLFVDVGGRSGSAGFRSNQAVASVDGQEITVLEFRNLYYNFYDSYRRYYNLDGSNMDLLKALRIDRTALDKLIKDCIVKNEAQRMGLSVSQQEIIDALRKMPGLNENGRFIGRARLEQMLTANHSTLAEFETSLISELLSQKVRGIISDGIVIPEEDIRKEYLETTQQATIEYVVFKPEDSMKDVTVVESELRSFYDNHKEEYRIGEQRRIKYLQVNPEDFRAKIAISEAEAREAYSSEGDHTEVHARHILFTIENPKSEEEVRKQAETVLAEARQGKDFADLAKKYSQDRATAPNGGDFGFIRRGVMVQEFSDAAFALESGSISDLVKSQHGIHIIKVEGKRIQPFEERRPQLEFQLKSQKSEDLARNKADEAAATLKVTQDINKTAKDLGIEIRESGFFRVDGSIPLLGQVAGLQDEVFNMKKVGDIGTTHKAALGFIIPQLAEKRDSFIPDFSEVRAAVIEGYKKDRAGALAESKARQFAASLRSGADLAVAAEKINNKPIKPLPFTRRGEIDGTLSKSPDVIKSAFSLDPGKLSGPIRVENNYVVFHLLSRDDFSEAKYQPERDAIKARLESQKRLNLFQAYVDNLDLRLRKEQKILINQPLIDRILG